MRTYVQKWGNSLALCIPKSIAAEIGLQKDASVEVSLQEGKLVITPDVRTPVTLEQLLVQVTDANLHEEIDLGPAVGHEAW